MILKDVDQIVVSPTTIIEVHSIIKRKLKEHFLDQKQALWLREQVEIDFQYYLEIQWNVNLVNITKEVINELPLKILDCLQLASAILAKADLFITSDQILYQAAVKRIDKAVFI